ncbi:MAG: phosphate ABC transporter ATP-binding protein [Bacillota bacterium]|nr:phosphate ABC transporter ATP-binding protein [Bacillota bacterium]MDW7683126.1 phosphate ABC transporter ATP-binding protein [Bacillota bacterium]
MANNKEIIRVANLTKEFSGREVLHLPHWSVPKGSITGIIGPSGAGKSTLLRILNWLEKPTRGEINYFGRSIPANAEEKTGIRRKMTMLFQKPVLFDTTVYENIAYGLKARNIPKKEIKRLVAPMLEKIGMAAQHQQRAKTLSGGEAQRIAMARALVLEPEILYLDEPTANLDPMNIELLEKMLLEMNRTHGTSVIIITHNLFQARRITDHVLFLCQGQLVEAGQTEQIFADPADERTQAFVKGQMIY